VVGSSPRRSAALSESRLRARRQAGIRAVRTGRRSAPEAIPPCTSLRAAARDGCIGDRTEPRRVVPSLRRRSSGPAMPTGPAPRASSSRWWNTCARSAWRPAQRSADRQRARWRKTRTRLAHRGLQNEVPERGEHLPSGERFGCEALDKRALNRTQHSLTSSKRAWALVGRCSTALRWSTLLCAAAPVSSSARNAVSGSAHPSRHG
jgi:hypothetical protein